MYDYSGNNGLGKTGETYIVGSDSLMRSNSRFFHKTILKIKVKSVRSKKLFKVKQVLILFPIIATFAV
jgi:hypothetical protein